MAGQAIAEPRSNGIPLYYDRFLDEREKRFVSEITRLEGVIKNGDDRLNDRIDELKEDMIRRFEEVKEEMNRRFEEAKKDRDYWFKKVDERFEKIDQRFEKIDQRFEKIDQRFEKIDQRFEKGEESINELRKEMNRHFRWMMGLFAPLILGVSGLLLKDLLNLTR